MCKCMYLCMYVCMHARMHACMYMYNQTCFVYMKMCIYDYTMYMLCIYIYMYVYQIVEFTKGTDHQNVSSRESSVGIPIDTFLNP